jgi:hypothetical protein
VLKKKWMLIALFSSLAFASVAVAWAGGWIFAQRKEYVIEPSFTIGEIGKNYFDVWLDENLSVPLNPGLNFDFGTVEKGQNVTREATIYIENTFSEDILIYFVFVNLPQHLEGTVTIDGGKQVPSVVIPTGSVAKVTVNLKLCSGLYSTPIIPLAPKFQINAYRWTE